MLRAKLRYVTGLAWSALLLFEFVFVYFTHWCTFTE